MSREVYAGLNQAAQRSPKPSRRTDVVPTQSSKYYNTTSISQPVSSHGSPIASRTASTEVRRGRSTYGVSRSGNVSPTLAAEAPVPHSISTSAFTSGPHQASYYADDYGSPTMDGRSVPPAGSGHHRSRSVTRVPLRNYHSLERDQDREFMPIREPRDRSLDRAEIAGTRHPRSRERSLDRAGYRERDDHVGYRDIDGPIDADPYREGVHMSRSAHSGYADTRHAGYGRSGGDGIVMELQTRLGDLQAQYGSMKRELEATSQKLGSSMHSIKTFWSPELKKERALRKEEAAKYVLINDQLKMLRSENQKQSALIRQLEEELRLSHMRNPDTEVQQHLEALYNEKEHMTKEIYLLRETIKELEMRIDTQKQTLSARDESIKKLMEIKGVGGKIMEEERIEYERLKGKLMETESRSRHMEAILEARDKDVTKVEELRIELNRRDQEIMAMGAKMKTLEEQHHDYQRHIAVLKESLCAKEEHYSMLQADVEELRVRLEEKNKLIEKKTQQTMSSSQDRNRLTTEVQELRDHMEIKDRKINVLQRKIENLEDLLKEKDNQVDMARARLSAMQAHHSSSEGALSSLEEAIGDKDKQISQLRDQRDRAEQDKAEERELHDRDIAEYKMKIHSLESEMDKLQSDLQTLRQQQQQQRRPSVQQEGPQRRASVQLEGPQRRASFQQEGAQQAEILNLRKELDDRQKKLVESDQKFKKCVERLKQVEGQLQQQSVSRNVETEKEVQGLRTQSKQVEDEKNKAIQESVKLKEDVTRLQAELERLLDIMTTSEKEKAALNEQISILQEASKDRDSKLQAAKRSQQSDRTKSAQMMEEARRRESEAGKDAAKAQEQVQQQLQRIEELEEALRESVCITALREVVMAQLEDSLKEHKEKINNLQSELKSLQKVHNARCTNCPITKSKIKELEEKLKKFVSERRRQLEELFEMKQEALSAAISEKDSHLAVLEVSGIKNENTANQVDKLKAERKRLVERIKTENETRVKMLLELADIGIESNGKAKEKSVQAQSKDVDEDELRSRLVS